MVIGISKTIKILVDADACPVKEQIQIAAKEFAAEIWMVASYDHRLAEADGVHLVQVDRSSQSADLYISNRLSENNVLITQDYGLAAIGLAKKAVVLSFRGRMFTNENIDLLLAQRHEHARKRRRGQYSKGPKPLTENDRKIFLHTLTKVLKSLQENE